MLKKLVAIELTVSLLVGIPTGVYAELPENEIFQSSDADRNENSDLQTELQKDTGELEEFVSEEPLEDEYSFEIKNSDANEWTDETESTYETESTIESNSAVSDYEYSIDGVSGTCKIKKYLGYDSVVEIPQQINGYTVTAIDGFYSNNIITKVVIPNGVKEISPNCFKECKNLQEVVLADSIESIGYSAFQDCESLSSINLSANLKTINEFTFCNTVGLKEITIPDNVKTIGDCAFAYSGVEKINLPENLEFIGYRAFDSTNLKEVVIPEKTYIDEWNAGVFINCKQLERVEFKGNTCLQSDEFRECDNLKEIIFKQGKNVIYAQYITSKAAIYGLSNSSAYNFANSNGNSFYPIDPPQNRKAEKVDNTTIKLSWTPVSKNASYKIYRFISENNDYSLITTVDAAEYTDYNLPENTKYYYKICVCYEGIEGKEIEGVLSSSVEGDLTAPVRITAKAAGYNTIKLTWKKVSGITGYYVYRKTSENGTYKRIATLKNVSSYMDKKAVGGNSYYYKVKAYRKSGSKKIVVNEGDVSGLARANEQPKLVLLKTGKTYTKYDVTGDGINDKVSLKYSASGRKNTLTIYVNGKKAGTVTANSFDEFKGKYEIYLCSVNTKAVFLSVRFESNTNDNQILHRLYRYKKGKFKSALNVHKALKIKGMQSSSIEQVYSDGIGFYANNLGKRVLWLYSLKNNKLKLKTKRSIR